MDQPDPRPPGPRDWKCDHALDGNGVHLRPRNDLIWHSADDNCPCGPTPIYLPDADPASPGLVVHHHALDHRPTPTGGFTPAAGPTGHRGDCGGVAA